jgi:hypothetical protein
MDSRLATFIASTHATVDARHRRAQARRSGAVRPAPANDEVVATSGDTVRYAQIAALPAISVNFDTLVNLCISCLVKASVERYCTEVPQNGHLVTSNGDEPVK